MLNIIKKGTAFALAALMLLSVLAGCNNGGNGEVTDSESGSESQTENKTDGPTVEDDIVSWLSRGYTKNMKKSHKTLKKYIRYTIGYIFLKGVKS